MLIAAGFTVFNVYDIVYYKVKPCCLIHAIGPEGVATILSQEQQYSITGEDDHVTPGLIMDYCAKPDYLISDFCGGRGMTAWFAASKGFRTLTSELHPCRMSCAMVNLSTMVVDAKPECVRSCSHE